MSAVAISLSSDVNDFVNKAEDKHVKKSIESLVDFYHTTNSWQPIIDNVQIWRDIVNPQKTKQKKKEISIQKILINQREESTNILKTGRRMSLYDKNKNVIVGRKNIDIHPRIEQITLNGEIIGWIGLVPSNAVKDSPASIFLNQQKTTYYVIATVTLLISLLMAILLAKHLTSPIKKLTKKTAQLKNGEFPKKIENNSKDEIGILSNHFNELSIILEKNQKNRHQWVSDTSHELRTPLTIIKSQLMAIQDGILVANSERTTLLINEIDKLSRIVDDLYQLSNSDIGGLTYRKVKLDPITLLKQTLNSYKMQFNQKNITVSHQPPKNKNYLVIADKNRLLQLFSNLIENSYRYTDAEGKIHITSNVENKNLIIQFHDSAPGVSIQNQDKIFDRFYRVEPSRNRSSGGSGLGLALCTKIVEAHQGSITCQDSPLGGLLIIVHLPIIQRGIVTHD